MCNEKVYLTLISSLKHKAATASKVLRNLDRRAQIDPHDIQKLKLKKAQKFILSGRFGDPYERRGD